MHRLQVFLLVVPVVVAFYADAFLAYWAFPVVPPRSVGAGCLSSSDFGGWKVLLNWWRHMLLLLEFLQCGR